MRTAIMLFLVIAEVMYVQAQNIIYVSPGALGTGASNDSPTNLQNALDIAKINGEEDELWLEQGNYTSTPYLLYLEGSDNMNISIRGGWNSTFNMQMTDIEATNLDGQGSNRSLLINGNTANCDMIVFIEYLMFSNGSVSDDNGGGLYVKGGNNDVFDSNIHLDINHVDFVGNKTITSGSGGGLFTDCTFELSRCYFEDNEAASNGGAIYSTYLDINQDLSREISSTTFENNVNLGNQGSDIWTNTLLSVKDCGFYGVEDGGSSGNGSAIYSNPGGDINIDRSLFDNITINYWGSAVQGFDADISISNTQFTNNKSGFIDGHGTVAFYHNGSAVDREVKIINCTFANNEGQSPNANGNAVHFRGNGNDELKIYNSIFWNNGTVPLFNESGEAEIDYSVSEYATVGFTEGANFSSSLNPYLNPIYNLSSNSPCIDAGNSDYIDSDWTDCDGYPRVVGEEVDMGCYEYQTEVVEIDEKGLMIVNLYPNPVSEKLFLEVENAGRNKCTIYNTMGSKIYEKEFNDRITEILVNNLPAGRYYLRIQNNESEIYLPFIKQ